MTVSENEELLRNYIHDVWERQNPAAVTEYLASDYRRHTSPLNPPLDGEKQLQRLRAFRIAFPDVAIAVVDVIPGLDRVAFRSIMTGTHEGEWMGIAPSGRSITVELIDVIRIEKGKFVEQWGGPDMNDLLRQLGAQIRADEETST